MDELTFELMDGATPITQKLDRLPDECPICHRACLPEKVSLQNAILNQRPITVEIAFKCPHSLCSHLFIAVYTTSVSKPLSRVTTYYLVASIPSTPKPEQFGENVSRISPQFSNIYNQAAEAERRKLDRICGPGYRKALEFLVKDYLVTVKGIARKDVEGKLLGPCIRDYLSGTNVATCASRAAWLGNDETHYTRKWTEKDIKDLKALVRLTVHWIESEMLTDQYEKDMPSK